jgi:hypothetical protein
MKLLIGGKSRNIYFRKDNTVYYKSNNNENDITKYFKKSGGLKKQYSNLLVEKRKTIIGGTLTFDKFSTIRVFADTNPNTEWDNKTIIEVYTKLLQMFLLAKIRMDNHNTLFETDTYLSDPAKIKFINALQIIAGVYNNDTTIYSIDFQTPNNLKYDVMNETQDFQDTLNAFTTIKKTILDNYNKATNLILQTDLNKTFANFNKLDNYRNNNISALFTQNELDNYHMDVTYDVNDIMSDNDVKKHILDIVSYQRIATKLRIIKEINETLPVNDVDYTKYQLKALDNLKTLMIQASIFQSNDIPSGVLSPVIPPVPDNQNIGTLYTNAPDINATASSNNVISNGANNRPVVIDNNPAPYNKSGISNIINRAFGRVHEAIQKPLIKLQPIKKPSLDKGPRRGRNPFGNINLPKKK